MLTLTADWWRRPYPTERFELFFRAGLAGVGPTAPRRPGPVSGLTAAAQPGGGVTIVFAPPVFAGDGDVRGDGLGVITDHLVSVNFEGWIAVGAGGGAYTFPGEQGDVVRVRALGHAGRPGLLRTIQAGPWVAPPPSGPGLLSWLPGPGAEVGEVSVQIIGAPISAGDGEAWGDGLGAIAGYEIAIDGIATAHGPTLPIARIVGGFDPGDLVPVSARALGYGGRPGALAAGFAAASAEPPSDYLVIDGDHLVIEGDRITI